MSTSNYKWTYKSQDKNTSQVLQNSLNIPENVALLLVDRGVYDYNQAKQFFRPSLEDFFDPFLMKGMSTAVDRLQQAIEKEQTIAVYGDYDVDGTCSVAMFARFLKSFISHVNIYQPDRHKEGYGISLKSVEWMTSKKIDLIIALDCGIRDIEAAKKLKKNKIDLIICDHHMVGDHLPDALSILNPKQSDCNYPFKELCGCGIGFKFIQAYVKKNNLRFNFDEYLQFAAIATAADVVPLKLENRWILKLGIKALNTSPLLCFKNMFSNAKRQKVIDSNDLVFAIAPRINAAGRLSIASKATEMLMDDNLETLQPKIQFIEKINNERKEIDEQITKEALLKVEKEINGKVTTVVYGEKWHKGVVGIVASRLMDSYYRPTVVLCKDGDLITGSARSVKGFDVYEILNNMNDLFQRFGGHKYAAGLTMPKQNLSEFIIRFEKEVSMKISKEHLIPILNIDNIISFEDLKRDKKNYSMPKLFRLIDQMAPFGPSNPTPNFEIKNLMDSGNSKIVGEKHLKLQLKHKDFNKLYDGIWFNNAKMLKEIKEAKSFNIVASLSANTYMNMEKLQLMIKDIKVNVVND
ncbi:MAG: single-stranded-DNA-specific exonuclease RecJ [Crocinitomicaceae bacterium]|nr:single-stranded-DNA-specific exonuclease RecJ [Crocinitomicaceae bacterium]|tara:strand:- start:3809 stop:5545 length:1737 start_codon:yes stop_codon:yes gene_type:complete